MDEAKRSRIHNLRANKAVIAEEINRLDAGEIANLNVDNIENLFVEQRVLPHLPPQTSEQAPQVFVGREADIEALISRLRLDAPQEDPKDIVAIHGMAGVGKTALMSALAYHPVVREALPDGVLRVDLGPEPDVMTSQLEWGFELGEDLSNFSSPGARKKRLLTLCSNKRALLILDNVWQAEAAKYLLVGGPACRTLVTTRNIEVAIALAGRETYHLLPISHQASIDLLHNLAPDAFEVEPDAMEELVSRLAGLPLALNIAGEMIDWAWRISGDISMVLADLQDREARLRMSTPDNLLAEKAEENSLRAVLQVSYERLPDEASKLAFRLLGVFDYQPAVFDRSAANALWGLPLSQAQKTILILASRAMLEPVGRGRYTLHAVLADYAASLLLSSGSDQYQHARHCQAIHYLGVARHYRREDFDRWQELDKDWDNLRAVANWASKSVLDNKAAPTDLRLAADYANCLQGVIQSRKIRDSQKWLQAGIEACRQLGRVEDQAWLNLALGNISLDLGNLEEATTRFQESANLFAGIPHLTGLSYARGNLGTVERVRGDYAKALQAYWQVLDICLKNDDRNGAAYAYYNLGDVLRFTQDRQAGRDNLEKCIELCRQDAKLKSLLIPALSLLAELNLMDGLVEQARNQADEAQKIAETTSSGHLLGIAKRAQAGVNAAFENHSAAHAQFLESVILLEKAEIHEELAETHEIFAAYLNIVGDGEASRQHLQAAVEIFDEIGAHARAEELLQRIEKF
jgi:tetratricopeptide (TPR) repeat protein